MRTPQEPAGAAAALPQTEKCLPEPESSSPLHTPTRRLSARPFESPIGGGSLADASPQLRTLSPTMSSATAETASQLRSAIESPTQQSSETHSSHAEAFLSQPDLLAAAISTSLLSSFSEELKQEVSQEFFQETPQETSQVRRISISAIPTLPSIQELPSSSEQQPVPEQHQNTKMQTEFQMHPQPHSVFSSLWEYIRGELTSGDFDESQDLKTERIRNFLSVPSEIEKLMIVGYLICLDSFLYIFTILPLRIFIAIWCMFACVFGSGSPLKPAQKTDVVKGALVCICTFLLQFFDASRLYHAVRGQAIIKLYVIFNVLEICDKLCSAFGHDILDSLFSTSYPSRHATLANRRISRITHFVVATTYIFAHSLVLFYQVMTLNVAINSYNNALMTLLLSNQFVEIKSSVFKRFEKENLFQLSCSDIVERFQLSMFLIIIALRNSLELIGGSGGGWIQLSTYTYNLWLRIASIFPNSKTVWSATLMFLRARPHEMASHIYDALTSIPIAFSGVMQSRELKAIEALLVPTLLVYATEILVDWLKHAFITKFNNISPTVYEKYCLSLFRDLLGTLKSGSQSQPNINGNRENDAADPMQMAVIDRSPIVARRIGFVSIPLACLVIRVAVQTMQMIGMLRAGEASETVAVGDASDPDEIGGWRIPMTVPRWLSATWIERFWSQSMAEMVFGVVVVIFVYIALIAFKLMLGIGLIRLAKSKLDASATETAAVGASASATATNNLAHLKSDAASKITQQSATASATDAYLASTIDNQKQIKKRLSLQMPQHSFADPHHGGHPTSSTLVSAAAPVFTANTLAPTPNPDISKSPIYIPMSTDPPQSAVSMHRFAPTSPSFKHDRLSSLSLHNNSDVSLHGPSISNTMDNNNDVVVPGTNSRDAHPTISTTTTVPDTSIDLSSTTTAPAHAYTISNTDPSSESAHKPDTRDQPHHDPMSPHINEEKLDRIDRFTMVKSRIV